MPYNSSYIYTPPSPEYPAVAGTVIRAASFNTIISDIGMALTKSMTDLQDPDLGASLIGFNEQTVQTKLEETVSVKDYGALGDGVTSDIAAFIDAFNDLNSNTIKSLYIPTGTYLITGELPALTAKSFDIHGDGYSSLLLKTSGTTGTFITLGSAVNYVQYASIHDLAFNVNHSGGILYGSVINAIRALDCSISKIKAGTFTANYGVASFIKLGDNTLGQRTQKIRISDISIHVYGPAAGSIFDIQLASATRISNVIMHFSNTAFSANPIPLHLHPADAVTPADATNNTIDSCEWNSIECNFPGNDVDHIMEIDATDGSIFNNWFTNCVFDNSADTAIIIHIDSGGLSGQTHRIANLFFTSCRSYPRSGNTISIDNTGNKSIGKIKFNGCTLASVDDSCIKVTNGNQKVQLKAIGCDFVDWNGTTSRPVIEVDAMDSLTLIGNEVDTHTIGDTIHFDNFVEISGATRSFIITNNDLTRITGEGVVRTDSITNDSDYRILSNNAGDATFVKKLTTTDATPTAVAAFDVDDNSTYYIEAIIAAIQSDASNRASYKLAATFYRNGGNAIKEGSTTTIHAIESDSTWNAELLGTATSVYVRVTGKAATTINWGVEATIKRLT